MAAKRLVVRRMLTGLLVGIVGLSVASRAWATLSFSSTETGFGNGPDPIAAAPPAASSGLPAVADFDGNGIVDLAVANRDSNPGTVAIFLGNASGFAANQVPFVVLHGSAAAPLKSPQGIAVGDFDEDGKTDIAVTSYSGNRVSIFRGNGNGTFKDHEDTITLTTLANPLGIVARDFGGPGTSMDIAVVEVSNGTVGKVGVFINNGGASFQARVDYAVGQYPKQLTVGDFGTAPTTPAMDGILDLAVSTGGTNEGVTVLFGSGGGQFNGGTKTLAAGARPLGITTGDFNNDGRPDIAVANHDRTTNTVTVILGCRQTPQDCPNITDLFSGATTVVNFNDGSAYTFGITTVNLDAAEVPNLLDLAVSNTGSNGAGSDRVALLKNNTVPGTRTPLFSYTLCPADDALKGIATGSFNSGTDAIDDIAVADKGTDDISILSGTGTGAVCTAPTQVGGSPGAAGKSPVALAACDIVDQSGIGGTGDGKQDLLLLDAGGQQVVIFSGDGAGGFTKTNSVPFTGTSATAIACGDINADGKKDFEVVRYVNTVAAIVCLNTGTATFSCSNGVVLNKATGVTLAALDATAGDDCAISAEGYSSADHRLYTCTDGFHTTDNNPKSVAAGMFGSGFNDLAVAAGITTTSNYIDLFFNNFNSVQGQFGPKVSKALGNKPATSTANQPVSVTTGLLNNDARADIVTANKNEDDVTVMIQAPGGSDFGQPASYLASNGPNSATIADFDLDGYNDVAVAGEIEDKVAILLGSASGTLVPCATGATGCAFGGGDGPASIQSGNFNADTKPDIAVIDKVSKSLTILINTSEPPPTPGPTPTPGGC